MGEEPRGRANGTSSRSMPVRCDGWLGLMAVAARECAGASSSRLTPVRRNGRAWDSTIRLARLGALSWGGMSANAWHRSRSTSEWVGSAKGRLRCWCCWPREHTRCSSEFAPTVEPRPFRYSSWKGEGSGSAAARGDPFRRPGYDADVRCPTAAASSPLPFACECRLLEAQNPTGDLRRLTAFDAADEAEALPRRGRSLCAAVSDDGKALPSEARRGYPPAER